MPKVSVITATRNNAGYIALALKSVLAEPFKDIELLVLDDASTDTAIFSISAAAAWTTSPPFLDRSDAS